jgi:hypothetical protein
MCSIYTHNILGECGTQNSQRRGEEERETEGEK